jgi:protoheme IX farnesyltransferase
MIQADSPTQSTLRTETSLLRAWLVLLRVRIASMVFTVTLCGALLAVEWGAGYASGLEVALYVTLVTGCASILNQVLERDTDALMVRTAGRPLVTGQVEVSHAIAVAVVLGSLGTYGLVTSFGTLPACMSLGTLVAYVAVYTPLKRVSSLNTAVGAIPGAAPPLIGYVALAGEAGPWAWCLFAILFVWQFPHFMAIAWMYREDYARAGLRMVGSGPDSDGDAGRQATVYALFLMPIALLPAMTGLASVVYAAGTSILCAGYLGASIAFMFVENRKRARTLMVVSLIYLPMQFALVFFDPSARQMLESI